jgi:hypothetical protein
MSREVYNFNLLENVIVLTPPYPSYNIVLQEQMAERGGSTKEIIFKPNNNLPNRLTWIEIKSYQIKKCSSSSKNKLIVLYIKNKNKPKTAEKKTIVYSHSNSVDLGEIYPFLIDLSSMTKVT